MNLGLRIHRFVAAAAALVAVSTPSLATTFTVTKPVDDGTTTNTGTLRWAIDQVNAQCAAGYPHTIDFNITDITNYGPAPYKIKPPSALPALTCGQGTTIDATTQPGWTANTQIMSNNASMQVELDGSSCSGCDGLTFPSGYVTVKGLAIHSFSAGAGILVTYGPVYIEANYIGTDATGQTAKPNLYGVKFLSQGYGTVGKNTGQGDGNLISGNSGPGIFVGAPLPAMAGNEGFLKTYSGPNAEVYYNQIGISSGGGSLGNGGGGLVYMEPTSNYANNVASNVIAYNTGPGVQMRAGNKVHLHANQIWGNSQTAFDLGSDGSPTQNDDGDVDTGPNDLFNKPTITSVTYNDITCEGTPCTRVTAELKAAGSGSVRFDFFRNDSSPATPEGKYYMGYSTAYMESGVATVSQNFLNITAVHITATASYDSCGECGAVTSEYSYPMMTGPSATASFAAGSAAVGAEVAYNVVVSNPNAFAEITNMAVSVTTPANLNVASAATLGDCATGGFAPVIGTNSASVSGATIPAGGTCTFRVMVYADTVGSFTMGPGSVTVSTDAGSASILSPALFNGTASTPTLQLFVASSVQAGVATPLTIAVSRTSGQPTFNSMTVTLSLPGGATITTAPTYGCPPGTGSPATGGTVISASNGAWSSSGACSFVFTNVTFPTAGTYTVTINAGDFTWKQGSSGTVRSFTTPTQASVAVVTPPAVSLSPASLAFGGQEVGTVSATQTVTITNTGGSNLVISSISGATVFPFTGCSTPITLAAGAFCTLSVKFAPTATTSYSGQLTITSNASGSPHAVNLTGFGTAPGVGLSPAPLVFGSVTVGTSTTANVTLNNPGTAPLQVSAITVSGSPAFTVGTGCVGTLAVQAVCQIPVTFSPTDTNPQGATLSVQSNASGSPHTVAISGTGIAPGVSLTPSVVAFGNVPVGGNASATLDLTNTGAATLLISGIVTTGTYYSNTTTCGSSLAPGASCQILVAYAPLDDGAHAGQVSVSTNAGSSPAVASLSGTGAVPVLTLSGTGLTFGAQTVGTASLPQTVTVGNTGNAPLNLTAITVTGDFNFIGCPTPLSIPGGGSCTLSIKFVPTAVGTRNGGISITSNASGSPHAITLTGEGTPALVPGIALAPSSASFGSVVVGTSATQVLVLSNPGTAPLAISSIAATGTGFSQANNCTASLAPGAACNISVTFAPAATGAASGQLQIFSNAAPSPLNAALTGTGLPATTAGLTLSASSVVFPPQFVGTTSAAKTVTLTSSGTAPLVISGVTGSGPFAFSGCGPGTMAPNATCTFSITFRPLEAGAQAGSIVVTSNASGSPHTITLSGDGASLTAPQISLSPSAFGFGTLRTGRTATLVGRLTNTGAAALAISQIQVSGAFFSQSNNCPATIAVGAFCDITVAYAPTGTGAHSGQLLIHSNAIPSPYVAAISGTGVVVPPPFLATNGPVSFGQQVVGTTTRRSLVLTNTGGDPLNITSMAIVGQGVFGVEGGCSTIAPEASCTLTVTFLPTALATFNARLDIVSNHSGGAVQVALSGQGVALPQPDLDFSVGALGFGQRMMGTAATPQTVRLTNIGGAPVTISAVRSTVVHFTVSAAQCIGTLAPGAFCDIDVNFTPFRPGPVQGSIVVDSSPVQNDSVSLVGIGCRPYVPGLSLARLCAP